MENLYHKRQVYEHSELLDNQVKENPIEQFRDWFLDADKHPNIAEANAMSISTIEDDDCPRTRIVLLKSYTWEGFIFYTNYQSKKGKAIEKNSKACLHFFWPALERQVMIKAELEHVSGQMSDDYFASRPRGSQLGAVVSPQSEIVPNREFLQEKLARLEKDMEGKEILRPQHWGGYLARPYEIEFWQGRPNRLHDRIVYKLQEDYNWKISRLAP